MTRTLTLALYVGAGGFIGSILRYLTSLAAERLAGSSALPLGTIIANLSGCLIIGVVAGFAAQRGSLSPEMKLFGMVGVLGGYTTFSAFGLQTIELAMGGNPVMAGMNVAVQTFVGLAAVWGGYYIGRLL